MCTAGLGVTRVTSSWQQKHQLIASMERQVAIIAYTIGPVVRRPQVSILGKSRNSFPGIEKKDQDSRLSSLVNIPNTNAMSSIPNLSLSSLLGNLSFSLMPHIHLTILISARWSATSFAFLTGQVSLPCNILLHTQLLYNLPLIINNMSLLASSSTSCLNLLQPVRFLASTAPTTSPSTLNMSPR